MVIVNPETKGPLGDSHLGEVSTDFTFWVAFPAVYFLICILSLIVEVNGKQQYLWAFLSGISTGVLLLI